MPAANAGITFHDLLRHEGGLGGHFTGSGADSFTIARVQMEIDAVNIGTFNYKNFNFLILRAALPILAGVVPADMSAGASLNNSLWDSVTTTFYRQFCNDRIFAAAGVGPFDFVAPAESTFAYPTPPVWPGAQLSDGTFAAGSGGSVPHTRRADEDRGRLPLRRVDDVAHSRERFDDRPIWPQRNGHHQCRPGLHQAR